MKKLIFPIIMLCIGLLVGNFLTRNYEIPKYEVPILAVHSAILINLDKCIDKKDFECIKTTMSLLVTSEATRANSILENGLAVDYSTKVKENLKLLLELERKYN